MDSIATAVSAFAITTSTTSIKLDRNRQAQVAFTVSNQLNTPLQARARIAPKENARAEWFKIVGDTERQFSLNGTQQFTVQITVPKDVKPGKYGVGLDMATTRNPDEEFGQGPTVAFEVSVAEVKKQGLPGWWWIPLVTLAVLLLGGGIALFLLSNKGPAVQLSSQSLSFTDQQVGTTSSPQTITVTNTGSGDLRVTAATTAGTNASAFKTTADHCSGSPVPANKTCTIAVAFAPQAAGPASAILNISDNAKSSPQAVTLQGRGAAVTPPPTTPPTSIGAGSFTVVASATISPGNFALAVATCPSGDVAIGGGVDLGNVFTMKVTASAPMFGTNRLLLTGDGSQGSPTGWEGAARNDSAATQSLKVAAICSAPVNGLTTQVVTSTVPAGTFSAVRVSCPSGATALSGGVDLNNVLTMRVTSSAPTFAANNTRLIFQPDGSNPGAIGWQASAMNTTSQALPMKAAVICAPGVSTSTMVASGSASSNGFQAVRVGCPSGQAALGGGTDLQNVLTMTVTSSGPTYAQNNNRLLFQGDGRQPGAVGWQASALNNDPNTQPFKIAVVCAS